MLCLSLTCTRILPGGVLSFTLGTSGATNYFSLSYYIFVAYMISNP
eukprot:SAG11_NODE_1412_length_4985_cov_14.954769_3_plen_46_part_00